VQNVVLVTQANLESLQLDQSPHLLTGSVEITEREKCNVNALNKITSTTLCAGPFNVNACKSDEGGPLLCNNVLYGLIDYRAADYCHASHTNLLGTYNDLSSFNEWISENADVTGAAPHAILKLSCLVLASIIIIAFN